MSSFLSSRCEPHQEEFEDDFVVVPGKKTMSQELMPPVFRMPKYGDYDLYEITVDELQHLFSLDEMTSVEYVRVCLQRVQRVGQGLSGAS